MHLYKGNQWNILLYHQTQINTACTAPFFDPVTQHGQQHLSIEFDPPFIVWVVQSLPCKTKTFAGMVLISVNGNGGNRLVHFANNFVLIQVATTQPWVIQLHPWITSHARNTKQPMQGVLGGNPLQLMQRSGMARSSSMPALSSTLGSLVLLCR